MVKKPTGILKVIYPTTAFMKWLINQKGLIYSKTKVCHISEVVVKNYIVGSYEGVLGVSATLNNKKVGSAGGGNLSPE